jgi:hypothetical protein
MLENKILKNEIVTRISTRATLARSSDEMRVTKEGQQQRHGISGTLE